MSKDLDILARTLFGEARGEQIDGKAAVANVILNRTRKSRGSDGKIIYQLFGNGSIESACLARYQFSCWNNNDPNRNKILEVKATEPYFAECIVVAKLAIAGLLIDNTKGSTHYHVLSMGFPTPWLRPGDTIPKPAVIIGKHAFYNTVK